MLIIFLVCACCPIMCLNVLSDIRYAFRIKTMFGSSLPPVVCSRVMSCLRYLYLLIIMMSITYCVVLLLLFFVHLVYPMLPVFLDC